MLCCELLPPPTFLPSVFLYRWFSSSNSYLLTPSTASKFKQIISNWIDSNNRSRNSFDPVWWQMTNLCRCNIATPAVFKNIIHALCPTDLYTKNAAGKRGSVIWTGLSDACNLSSYSIEHKVLWKGRVETWKGLVWWLGKRSGHLTQQLLWWVCTWHEGTSLITSQSLIPSHAPTLQAIKREWATTTIWDKTLSASYPTSISVGKV